jgi:t-SNARE complex subunit (syntaxin)
MNHAPRPSAFERRTFVEELEHVRAVAARGARARRLGCVGVLVVACAVLAVMVWR